MGVKIGAAYGRLYVNGPDMHRVQTVRGAAFNKKRNWYEVSLTLETLRAIRTALGVSKAVMASYCTPEVMTWVRAVAQSEREVADLHRRLANMEYTPLPWQDWAGDDEGQYRFPFEHQKVLADTALALDGCAFLCEMGTAKTRPAIEAMAERYRRGDITNALVIAPKGGMTVWLRQVPEWTNAMSVVMLADMPVKERGAILMAPGEGKVFVVNYDVIHALLPAILHLARGSRLGLILDEIHTIRNPQAKWTDACMRVAQEAAWRVGITGSPILNGAHNIWSQWYVVDLGISFGANFVQFRREFFDPHYSGYGLMPKPGTLETIGNRMRRRGVRYKKDDCMDLPPKIYETVDVVLSPAQKKAYEQMRLELVAELENEEIADAATQLVSILRLTQITSGYVGTDRGIYTFDPNPKLDQLEQFIDELIGDQQIIVWAWYVENVRVLCERLRRYDPVRLVGGMSLTERAAVEQAFQSGHNRLLIGNPASGGQSVDLFKASTAIYYSQNFDLLHRLQSEDRCHRQGSQQHRSVTYLDLVARGTVDEVVSNAIRAKKEVADVVVDLRQMIGLS